MNLNLSIKKTNYLQEEFIDRRILLQNLAISPDEFPNCSISALQLIAGNKETYLQTAKNKLMAEQGSLREGKKICS